MANLVDPAYVFSYKNLENWGCMKTHVQLTNRLTKSFTPTQSSRSEYNASEYKAPEENNITCDTTILVPKERDSLFWCFYIVCEGLLKYQISHNNVFRVEKEKKIEAISKLRDVKAILKGSKLNILNIESNLLTNPKISLAELHALCIAYEKSIIYVKNRCVYRFLYGDETIAFIEAIQHNNKNRLTLDMSMHDINDRVKDLWDINVSSKPLKGISTYKLSQLQDICEKLGIDIMRDSKKKRTKTELYSAIKCVIEEN